jgi:hypothetical protein
MCHVFSILLGFSGDCLLRDFYTWCLSNRLTPHPDKSEVMVLSRGTISGPIASVYIGDSILRLVTKTRLLSMTVDDKLSWTPHVSEVKKSFITKLELLKWSRFLPKNVLRDFYFKVILPSVKYCLILWGSCCNSDMLDAVERLHCRAARIIFNLPKDMASSTYYKLDTFALIYKATNNMLPYTMSKGIVKKRCSGYSLRGLGVLIIPRFNTRYRYMKDSVEYRGSVLSNFVHYNEQGVEHHQLKYLKEQLRLSSYFIDFKFDVASASTIRFRQSEYVYI